MKVLGLWLIGSVDGDGRTPLSYACGSGNVEVVKLLLSVAGIDVLTAGMCMYVSKTSSIRCCTCVRVCVCVCMSDVVDLKES